MVKIEDCNQVLVEMNKVRSLKNGFITNCYVDKAKIELWCSNDLLFVVTDAETSIILKKNEGFFNLYFYATTVTSLQKSVNSLMKEYDNLTFVTDLVGNDTILPVKQAFLDTGFAEYTSLVRMNRLGVITDIKPVHVSLSEATKDESSAILDLFHQYFDPYAEQIPMKEELEAWMDKGHILVCKEGTKIVGFIIFDLNGVTLFLRYWFVHPDYRDQKIGSKLFNFFYIKGQDTKRQIFWVIESNENAIKRYKHFGFVEEHMFDYILIKHPNNSDNERYSN